MYVPHAYPLYHLFQPAGFDDFSCVLKHDNHHLERLDRLLLIDEYRYPYRHSYQVSVIDPSLEVWVPNYLEQVLMVEEICEHGHQPLEQKQV